MEFKAQQYAVFSDVSTVAVCLVSVREHFPLLCFYRSLKCQTKKKSFHHCPTVCCYMFLFIFRVVTSHHSSHSLHSDRSFRSSMSPIDQQTVFPGYKYEASLFLSNAALMSALTSSSFCFCLFFHPLLYRRQSER